MKFSFIDIFLIGGLAYAGYLGYRGGLVKKIFNLMMLIVALVVAVKLMRTVGSFFSDPGVLSEAGGNVAGFGLVMIAVMLPAILLYRKFGKSGTGSSSSTFVSVILGVIEGALIISFILVGLKVFDVPEKDTRQESLFYKPLVNFVPKLFDLLQAYFPGGTGLKEEYSKRLNGNNPSDTSPLPRESR
jgi:uncharacterized membrane protein required for colicin V production